MPRSRRRQTAKAPLLFLSSLALLLLAAPLARADVENDFSLYPSAAQPCLEEADEQSSCQGDTVEEMNDCLCSNRRNFVTHAARCLGARVPATLRIVYSTMETSCDDTDTPLSLDEDEFMQIGAAASSSSNVAGPSSTTTDISSSSSSSSSHASSTSIIPTTLSSASSPTSSPQSTTSSTPTTTADAVAEVEEDNDETPPLSTGAMVGISVGSAAGVAFILATFIIAWKKARRNRAAHDEARPMLDIAGGAGGGGGGAAPWNTSPGIGSDGGKSGDGVYPSAPPQDWKAADGKPGWRPASQSPASGLVFPGGWPPQDGGWDAQHSQQQQQQQHGAWGYYPGQPWPGSPAGGPQQKQPPKQALGPVAELSSENEQPGVGNPGPDAGLYELASMPAAVQLPKEPVEIPGSLGRFTESRPPPQSQSAQPGLPSHSPWGR
ncbi:hypothetical protein SODALDRAFT_322456 [Sodiomyces alkalinus F11]|uniref:Extracellular membrane protein CFEM domain-containing protein n=1 Tax=Sodiomyces alkalinus (strain CBS 110278 / VKM F-3762 / F11) TaxID=1314773 RepID=A0A3N2Q3S8_SODAK|nr:hypothetical protein SODALDRAFT_322456 [Sodiomyces alkalinus F11]ROT41285.1 hypothetical protein SODALDRAFT_322456 [Sodiomyces alkalinus F11]